MRTILISLGLLLLTFNQLFSQDQLVDSTKTEQLNEVVVTAQFAPKSEKNAIYKVKVINLNTIEARAANNLTELLRYELNIDLSHNAVFGAGIELNGISKENIKILLDGVPLIGRVNGVLNLNQINLNAIDRIEVIEGPVSVFYGTDAMGGIVNLISKKDQSRKFTGNISAYYEGRVDAKDINGSFGSKFGNNLIRVESGHYYFNGINTDDNLVRTLNWPKRNQYYTNVKYNREIGDFKLRFSSNFSEEGVTTLGEISSRSNTAKDIDYTTKRWDNSLNFQGKLNKDKFLDLTISYLDYDRFDTSYLFDPETNTSELITNNPDENGNYFNTLFTKGQYAKSNPTDKLNYVLGIEFITDHAKGNRILDGKKNITNTSFFSSINYKLTDKLEVQPALRYTYNSSFKNLWSPAFNLKYRFNTQHALRLAYGNGYRAPSIKELYLNWNPTFGPLTYTFSGNEHLEVESSHNFNLYYTYEENFNNGSYLLIEPSFNYNQVENLIGLSQLIGFERQYINLNKTKSLVTSLDVKYKPIEDLQFNLGLSYLGRYLEYSDVFNSDTFLFTPYVNAAISYNYNPLKVSFNTFYKYSGKRKGHFIEEVDGVDLLKSTTREDYNNLDISITKILLQNKLSLSIGGKNLFNVTDIETFNQIGSAHERNSQFWETSYYLKVQFNF